MIPKIKVGRWLKDRTLKSTQFLKGTEAKELVCTHYHRQDRKEGPYDTYYEQKFIFIRYVLFLVVNFVVCLL